MAPPLDASASSSISVAALVREPPTLRPGSGARKSYCTGGGIWKRGLPRSIQATDQRYDGRDTTTADGVLTQSEGQAALKQKLSLTGLIGILCDRAKTLDQVLLALYFNLATRRLNAGMALASGESTALGLANARDSALHARATLLLPFEWTTKKRYNVAIVLLETIND